MKKIFLIIAAALAFSSCGNKAAPEGNDVAKDSVGTAESAQVYTNDKYGFSVTVPKDLKRGEASLMGDDGAIYYTADTEEGGIVLNRVDITGHRHIFEEPYTQEKVKEEFEEETSGKEGLVSKECKDMEFSYTIKSEDLTEIHRKVYSGANTADVIVCYDAGHEAQLGGKIAEEIISSLKFK